MHTSIQILFSNSRRNIEKISYHRKIMKNKEIKKINNRKMHVPFLLDPSQEFHYSILHNSLNDGGLISHI